METATRSQRTYDHRLEELVHESGDIELAIQQGVPRSTARGWLHRAHDDVITLDTFRSSAKELRREVIDLRRRNRKPKVGIRATSFNELWHVDATVIQLLDNTKAYLHAVVDSFSRRILSWKVSSRLEPGNTVEILLKARPALEGVPAVVADSGLENVNAKVEDLIESGTSNRLLAMTEINFSNSLVEAWWRSLKHLSGVT